MRHGKVARPCPSWGPRHFRCTLKIGRRQAQGEVHSIAHVSSDPYPTQLSQCLGLLQSLLAREIRGRSRLLGRSSQMMRIWSATDHAIALAQ